MTNEEIWKRQQEHRAHVAAVPEAIARAKAATEADAAFAALPNDERPRDCLTAGHVRTLVREVERLQAALKQANQDLRDEQREAQHAASSAYSEGRHDGMQEGRCY